MQAIIQKHITWFNAMGYREATPLESLALIAGEIGEAVNECRQDKPTEAFGEELADIILRVITTADRTGVDIEAELYKKIEKNIQKGDKGRLV